MSTEQPTATSLFSEFTGAVLDGGKIGLAASLAQEITDTILMNGAPDNEQIILHVAIPGLTHAEVMPTMRAFQRARWDDLLAEIGDDVCIVSEGSR